MWASLAVGIPILVSLLSRMDTVDLAYHLRAGTDVLAGAIPRVNTYTFTASGSPWVDQQWLAQGVLRAVSTVGGWASLAAFQAALIGLTFWLLYLTVRTGGVSPRAASLLTLSGFLVASPELALRPQLFALPLFAALLLVVAQRSRHPSLLWLAPPLAMLCANVHGSFPLFPLIVGLAWLEDRRTRAARANRTLVVAAVTAAATVVTPYGPLVWTYAYDLSTNPVIRNSITEWAPLSLGSAAGRLAIGSFLATIAYLLRRRTATPWTAQLTLGLFFVLALSAERALLWWALVTPAVLGALIGGDHEEATETDIPVRQLGPRAPAYAIMAVLFLAILALLPWWRGDDPGTFLRDAPGGIASATGSLPSGAKILVYQPWASWLEYTNPNDPVFVDSRVEVLPESVWDDYAAFSSGSATWSDVLDRWGVDAVVGPNDWAPMPILDAPGSGWQVVYRDGEGAVATRT